MAWGPFRDSRQYRERSPAEAIDSGRARVRGEPARRAPASPRSTSLGVSADASAEANRFERPVRAEPGPGVHRSRSSSRAKPAGDSRQSRRSRRASCARARAADCPAGGACPGRPLGDAGELASAIPSSCARSRRSTAVRTARARARPGCARCRASAPPARPGFAARVRGRVPCARRRPTASPPSPRLPAR